ncbi:MAG: leukotriene A4 hydrolase C-terminal domain-containing protein [Deltaproteobacteria bacterium]|nr:leukotriene A4 hydrolase C-terminal domain-containing protein [Deltaproteobacteria bacterium]
MGNDPHSYTDVSQGRTTDLALDWTVDFAARTLRGTACLTLDAPKDGPLDLDTRDLQIAEVLGDDGAKLAFELGDRDPVVGQRLRIQRDRPIGKVTIRYESSPQASALLWLEPSQTDGGEHPFVLSQCQAIHARSMAPVQDSPQVRATYTARVTIPAALSAVMSAAPGTEEPSSTPELRTLAFAMPQPIPSYLLALAVGDLDSRDLGPRTRVYAEPGVVEGAAWEFAEVEQMLEAAETLFGTYPWERYDFIVLPPSFPMGGMENPRMTFLTPTLLAGDRSLVSVLAHELAHSWTGNLINNATNEEFWLNEGWTVYAERRILAAIYSPEVAAQQSCLARVTLDECIEERKAAGQKTALHYRQDGLDPDEDFSRIPYEKGFLLITALERAVGIEAFDAFIEKYLARFRFQSLTTADFAKFVGEALPEAAQKVDLDTWIYAEGLPADTPEFQSERLAELAALATDWSPKRTPKAADWSTTETLYFVSQLKPVDAAATEALGEWLGLRTTGNAELQCVWLTRAAEAGVAGIEPELRKFIGQVGRTKLLKPVIAAMAKRAELRPLAEELIEANRPRWHGSTRGALDTAMA